MLKKMFRKNSAFTPTSEEVQHLNEVRHRALNPDKAEPVRKEAATYADICLEQVEYLLTDTDNEEALRLIRQARDELNPGS